MLNMCLRVTSWAVFLLSLSLAFASEVRTSTSPGGNVELRGASRSIGYGLNGVFINWTEARTECHSWDATLAFPNSLEEFDNLKGFLMDLDGTTREIHIGFHSEFVQRGYVTLDGLGLDETGFREWDPNSANSSSQRCGALSLNGLKTIDCSTPMWSVCEFWSSEFEQIGDFGRYKFHTEARNWTDAMAWCHVETGYLLILRSQSEYDAIYEHYVERGIVVNATELFYGAHHYFNDHDFVTLAGETLEESGFAIWGLEQPGNFSNSEFPLVNLLLADSTGADVSFGLFVGSSDVPLPFICKRDLY